MTGERLHCQTPGCRRTRKACGYAQWVCQKCYEKVPAATRREHVEAKKVLRMKSRRQDRNREEIVEAWNRSQTAWAAVKDAARGGLPDEDFLMHIGLVDT
ncbi:hypothetical protein G6L37_06600 [Agrobacterium rubi]|nr:hypothetical protein [Agrobacterium rubi]NTF25033.1 hypothetical protein [Agrobacterium rubi]